MSITQFAKRLESGVVTVCGKLAAILASTIFIAGMSSIQAAEAVLPAEWVIQHARILTVDSKFSQAEALAVRGGRLVAVGSNRQVAALIGPETRIIDAHGKMVLPGLGDSHVHSYRASVSEFSAPLPALKSLAEAFQYIRQRVASQPSGSWILLERVYPTRLEEGRLPTLAACRT